MLDHEYYIGTVCRPSFDLLGLTGGVVTFGDPRTYGVTLEYNFF